MNTEFVPSGEVAAILSQLASSRLDLKKSEGLNGIPERYYKADRLLFMLGLSDNKNAVILMSKMMSEGIAVSMATANSLDRFASILPNSGNVLVTHPQGSELSPCGASPQGYTCPSNEGACKHHQDDGRDGVDLSPLPTASDLMQSKKEDR